MLIDFDYAINSLCFCHATCILNLHWTGRFLQVIPRLKIQKQTSLPVGSNLEIPCPKKRNAVSLANAKTEDHCSLFFNGTSPCDTLKKKSLLSPQVVPAALCNLSTASRSICKSSVVKCSWVSKSFSSAVSRPPGGVGTLVLRIPNSRRSTTVHNRF